MIRKSEAQSTEYQISKKNLFAEMRQVMSIASQIIEGFSPPYVNMASRRLLKRFLELLLKYFNVFKSIDIEISEEITSHANSLYVQLRDFFQTSAIRIDRSSRVNVTAFVETVTALISKALGNDKVKVLSANRIEAMAEIISEIMNQEGIKYSVEYLPDKRVVVYVGAAFVDSTRAKIIETMKLYNLVIDMLEVIPAIDGLILSDCRTEGASFIVGGAPVKQCTVSEDGEFISAGSISAIVTLPDAEGEVHGLGALTADHMCTVSINAVKKLGPVLMSSSGQDIAVIDIGNVLREGSTCMNLVHFAGWAEQDAILQHS